MDRFLNTNKYRRWLLALGITGSLSLACGVKAPPLPPLPVTPQQSDNPSKNKTKAKQAIDFEIDLFALFADK